MTYSEIIAELYSDDVLRIITILNKSVYASNINKTKKNILVVHTGFVFNTHNKTPIEILYDLNTEVVIRQPRKENFSSNIPLINGLWAKGNGKYFGLFYALTISQIKEKDNDEFEYLEINNPYQYFHLNPIKEIEVKDYKDKFIRGLKVIGETNEVEYPFQKRFTEEIFYDGNIFRKNIHQEEYYKNSQNNNND